MEPPRKDEIELLDELRGNIADLEMSEEDLADKNLVRFLRARNGNLDAAELMIRNNREWQVAENVKSLLWDFEYPEYWDHEFKYTMTGFDRWGNPFFVVQFGKWDMQREMASGNKEEFIKFVYHHMERLWTCVKRMSKGEDHIKQIVAIADLDGLSFRQVTSLDVIEAAIRCLKTFEANHPETVRAGVVVNAPWAFQLIWKIIKPFLSEHTHSKLNFVGSDKEKWREAILEHAELNQFPEFYGGTAPDSKQYFIARDGTWTISKNQNEFDEDEEYESFDEQDQPIIGESY